MKIYVKSTQAIFAGTKYDKKAAQILVESGLYNESQAATIIDALFRQDIHAFTHAPSWTEKYLVGIARMCVEESGGNQQGVARFIENSVNTFDNFLTYVKENRDKLGGADFDTKFMKTMKYQEVVDMMDKIQAELDRKSEEELSKMNDAKASSNFEVVPIESYNQMNELFGGHWTGDGSSDKYAGGGGTAWCHTNSKSVYDSWVNGGRSKFYILANKHFKDIPFNAESNRTNPKDDYGNSLIALLVDKRTGKLLRATLRCNHVGVSSSADNQYKTYAELSQIAGFNVKDAILEDLGKSGGNVQIKSASLDKPKFEVGDRITLELSTVGEVTATAVLRFNDGALFVYDDTLDMMPMAEVDDFLESIVQELPDKERMSVHRLLQASEVFSECDDPSEWDYLTSSGVEMENPQIPYFVSQDNRRSGDDKQWWLSTLAERGNTHYVVVDADGECNCLRATKARGVRPAFTIYDAR